jgi:hypothetical protein
LTTSEFVDFVTPLAMERKREGDVLLHGWNLSAKTIRLPASDDPFSNVQGTSVRIRREAHPCYDFTRNKQDAPFLSPFTVTGRLDKPQSADTISFQAAKGKSVSIQLESPSLHLALTPVVRIRDADGKQLARVEPAKVNADLDTTFSPPADGVYRIDVRDLHNNGGPRFAYRLRVVPLMPSFDLTVPTDRFVLSVGKPLTINVSTVRKNGLADDIELSMDGLPADVSLSPAKSGKPEPKSQTLRLEAKKAGFNGPIRIIGKAASDKRHATAPLETFTTDLWLTVIDSGK